MLEGFRNDSVRDALLDTAGLGFWGVTAEGQEKRAWTTGRVVATILGLALGLLGIFLLVWGLALVAGLSGAGLAAIVLLPVGLLFAVLGVALILAGGALAGVPWIARAVRRRRQRRRDA